MGTFLNEDNDDYQKNQNSDTQTEPEKVTNLVGTFLNEDSNDANQTI
ncbi:hypothetical protein [Emticicia sp. C21]|nr:hypothetical protein [Emticicia sp. C21]